MASRLCTVVDSFDSPVRKIFPRISLHDLPRHGTMRKCLRQVSQTEIFGSNIYFFNCPQYPWQCDILVECNPNNNGQEMMLVLQDQRHS